MLLVVGLKCFILDLHSLIKNIDVDCTRGSIEKYILPLVILSGQLSRKVECFAWVIQASGGAGALDSSIEVSESLRGRTCTISAYVDSQDEVLGMI